MFNRNRMGAWVLAVAIGVGGGYAWAKITRQSAEAVQENGRVVVKGIAREYGDLVTVCVDPTGPGRQWMWFRAADGTLRRITLYVPPENEDRVLTIERPLAADTNTLVE